MYGSGSFSVGAWFTGMMLVVMAFVGLAVAPPLLAVEPAELQPLGFLVGEWAASGSGQPGAGSGSAVFSRGLQDRVIVRKSYAEYPPAADKPGSRHDDLMIIYAAPGGGVRADYYDNEGHVIRYRVQSPAAGQALFLSDAAADEPRFRLSYSLGADGVLKGEFGIAPPGAPEAFKTYLAWDSHRAAAGAAAPGGAPAGAPAGVPGTGPTGAPPGSAGLASVLGTWAGSSTCVGDRPACKNEEVVYRFVVVDGKPGMVRLLADKIIDGKRVPMYTLDFHYRETDQSMKCEFTRGQTHGVWAYTVSGEAMIGTLEILPDRMLGRRVSVHRVRDDQVPAAPALDQYAALPRAPHMA